MKRVAVMLWIVLCAAGVALAQTEWVQYPDNPVIGPGEPGSWDDGGRWVVSVIRVDDTYHLWYGGYDDPLEANGIGHATSPDGVEWTMDPANPVLTQGEPGAWDRWFWFPSPAVMYDGSEFHMWYAATASTSGDIIQGGYATSPDGSAWTKYEGNPVLDVGPPGSWDDDQVRPATVILDDETYKMWYSGFGGSSGIGYAESPDGIDWTKHPEPVLGRLSHPGGWDKFPIDPSVVFDGFLYHMWYAGHTTGDWKIGYAFSTDGINWTRHRDNPVVTVSGEDIYTMPVVFDGSTWHGWYGFGYGQALNYATSDDNSPGVAALDRYQYVPAAALASGAAGSFYETDLDLSNASDQPVEYQLKWLPRGEDCSDPMTSDVFSLGAGMSVRYSNVLAEMFQLQPDSLGALAVASTSPDLLAMSRTYNIVSTEIAGTFGQAMPGVPTDDFIRSGDRRRILFGTENADMRTNLGCQAGSDGVAVRMELFDMEGSSLATETVVLRPWGNDQINRIFEDFAPITGYVDVWTPMSGGAFYCYGSVLDNVTSDPTTVLPQ